MGLTINIFCSSTTLFRFPQRNRLESTVLTIEGPSDRWDGKELIPKESKVNYRRLPFLRHHTKKGLTYWNVSHIY